MVRKAGARRATRSLRILAGTWRSRKLELPVGTDARPTPGRVRETVFNWLRDRLAGARCLDLYAGSGALGFEALSRGAADAWFVERDPKLVAALRKHAAALHANARIVAGPVERFLADSPAESFDIVFLDAPYSVPLEPVLAQLPPLLADSALVYIERPVAAGLPESPSMRWHRRGRAASVSYGLAALTRGDV